MAASDFANETWKAIAGYEGKYEISDHGRVRSRMRRRVRIIKGWLSSKGYRHIELTSPLGKTQCCVHRLVALHFIPNPLQRAEVDHIDCIKDHNHVSNLRWCNRQENMGNTASRRGSSSRFKGVSLNAQTRRWVAAIRVDGKLRSLGTFTDEREAAQKYNSAAKEAFGDFAWLNDV